MADNRNLTRAIYLVQHNHYSVNAASRSMDVPRATLKKALKNFEDIKDTLPKVKDLSKSPVSATLETSTANNVTTVVDSNENLQPVLLGVDKTVALTAAISMVKERGFTVEEAVSTNNIKKKSLRKALKKMETEKDTIPANNVTTVVDSIENLPPVSLGVDEKVALTAAISMVKERGFTVKEAASTNNIKKKSLRKALKKMETEKDTTPANNVTTVVDSIENLPPVSLGVDEKVALNEALPSTTTELGRCTVKFSPKIVDGEDALVVRTIETPTILNHIYTPSPSPPRYEFELNALEQQIEPYKSLRRKVPGPSRQSTPSPVPRPSMQRNPSPSSRQSSIVRSPSPLDLKRTRLNVVEKADNSISHRLIKYCPFCRYQTDDNKMTRHIRIKHVEKIRKPVANSLQAIGKIFGSESRRSVTLVPMDVIRDQLGPYWDDIPYRKIAFRICVMGRIKVYGGQWNLPDAPMIEDPFAAYYRTPEASNQTNETRLEAQTRVEPQGINQTPTKRPYPTSDDDCDSNIVNTVETPTQMQSPYLDLGHEADAQACKNYIANVSRVHFFVTKWLKQRDSPTRHWSSLLSCSEEPYVQYFEEREKLGQTIATSINYLKNLNTLFTQSINLYCMDDDTFPKNFDGTPSDKTVNGIKVLQKKLHILYSKKLKQQTGELFKRKITEAENLPEYTAVEEVMTHINADIGGFLDQLEDYFGPAGAVKVSSDKSSTPGQRHISGIWRRVTCGLAIRLLWTSKQRSGVVSNMLVSEWQSKQLEGNQTVVIVSKHKTGDKEPAALVMDVGMADWMERYYALRVRMMGTEASQFFVTNTGNRVVKLYEDVNRIYGLKTSSKGKLSASTFRIMIETKARSHGPEVGKAVATCLQHGEGTALKYYRLPSKSEAVRRQKDINLIDQTELFEAIVMREFDSIFGAEPYVNMTLQLTKEKLLDSDELASHPGAAVTDSFVNKMKNRYDAVVMEKRVEILFELVKEDYDRSTYLPTQ
ncbi:hypothetical protein ACI65C_006551 [Semiaphis heraclei]